MEAFRSIQKIGTGGIGISQASQYPGAQMGMAILSIDRKRLLIGLDGNFAALQILVLFEDFKINVAHLSVDIAFLQEIHLESQHPLAYLQSLFILCYAILFHAAQPPRISDDINRKCCYIYPSLWGLYPFQ